VREGGAIYFCTLDLKIKFLSIKRDMQGHKSFLPKIKRGQIFFFTESE
jgi:hypothetical protein